MKAEKEGIGGNKMKKLLLFAVLCLYPLEAKAVIFDFMGVIQGRDRLPAEGRGIIDGSPITGFFDIDRTFENTNTPIIRGFQFFVGTLTGYNLDFDVRYLYAKEGDSVFYGTPTILGEWVESGDQRAINPRIDHKFLFLSSFTFDRNIGVAGVYGYNDKPMAGIPEFVAQMDITERRPRVLVNKADTDQPVPEPSTIALSVIGLIMIRKPRTEK